MHLLTLGFDENDKLVQNWKYFKASAEAGGNEYGYREGTWPKNLTAGKVVWLFGRLMKRIIYHLGISNWLASRLDSETNISAAYGRDFSVHEKDYLDSEPGQVALAEVDQFLKEAQLLFSL